MNGVHCELNAGLQAVFKYQLKICLHSELHPLVHWGTEHSKVRVSHTYMNQAYIMACHKIQSFAVQESKL